MELKEVFPGVIWSIKYAGDEKNIFAIRMEQWRDVEYLESFFDSHKQFIKNNEYFKGYTLADVIVSAKKDATKLLKYINLLYNNTLKGRSPNFIEKFLVLEKPPYNKKKKARKKLYGRSFEIHDEIGTVFRLYAIQIDSEQERVPPAYVITGGGIKLTDQMKRMKELNEEYNKMISAQEWLEKKGITTKETLYNLYYGQND